VSNLVSPRASELTTRLEIQRARPGESQCPLDSRPRREQASSYGRVEEYRQVGPKADADLEVGLVFFSLCRARKTVDVADKAPALVQAVSERHAAQEFVLQFFSGAAADDDVAQVEIERRRQKIVFRGEMEILKPFDRRVSLT
jgi:hypothetical protein